MILGEKFVAVMKNYNAMKTSNEDLKNQNECLIRQVGDALKRKKRNIASSHSSSSHNSTHEEESERDRNPFASSSEDGC